MSRIDKFINDLVMPETFEFNLTEHKEDIFRSLCLDMLSRTLEMFEYDGLPETLSARSMEIEMQTRGFCAITQVDKPAHGKAGLYCIRTASPSGLLNADRLPTRIIGVDPWLNFDKDMEIGTDCIVIANDNLWRGMGPSFALHAGQLADAETTMRLQLYNSRINKILTATDDKVVQEAKTLLEDIKSGKWGVIGDEVEMAGMMKALSSIDFTSPHAGTIKDTMEVIQYYLAHWFISLGLNDNFNMKREALNGSETESNANTLFASPLMWLKYREQGIKALNERYGLSASVRFGSVWATAYKKYLLSIKVQEKEAETTEAKPEETKPAETTADSTPEETPNEQPKKEEESDE